MKIDSDIIQIPHLYAQSDANEKAEDHQVINNDSFWLQINVDLKSIFLLMKKLCDVIRSFNEKVQELAFKLDVNVLNTKQSAINDAFHASLVKSIGGGISGIATLGVSGFFSPIAGKAIGSISESSLSIASDKINASAQNENVLADYQTKSAQSFAKSSDALISTSHNLMGEIIDMWNKIIQIINQSFSSVANKM